MEATLIVSLSRLMQIKSALPGGGSNLATDLASINASVSSHNTQINNLQSEVSSLASGSPLVANSVSGMIDTSRVYVNTTDGKWYYYNGSSWTAGGIYQSAEDSQTVTKLKYKVNQVTEGGSEILTNTWISGMIGNNGQYQASQYGMVSENFYEPDTNSINFVMNEEYKDIYMIALIQYNKDEELISNPQNRYSYTNLRNFLISYPHHIGYKYKIFYYRLDGAKISASDEKDGNQIISLIDGNNTPLTAIDLIAREESNNNSSLINKMLNKFNKWNAIGDSITWLNDNSTYTGYITRVCNELGIEDYINNGKSGFSTNMMTNIESYIDNTCDLCTFFMGTNDFGRCNTLEVTRNSCNTIFSKLVKAYATKSLFIILPIQRWGYTGDNVKGPQPTLINSDGISLREYCDTIKEVAEKYSIPVLDLYYKSGIEGGDDGNTSQFLYDGLHPNDDGFELIANAIVKFLLKPL